MNRFLPVAAFATLAISHAIAQAPPPRAADTKTDSSCHGSALIGSVRDSTSAIIPGAILTLDSNPIAFHTTPDGMFRLSCIAAGSHRLVVTAPGFAQRDFSATLPRTDPLNLVLRPQAAQTEIDVNGDDASPASTTGSGPSQTLAGKRLEALADDPDDLLQELQQLASASGGNPANTTISVDGFQGSSSLPPKSSIAYIEVNPDQFSAQYREPPFGGGRVNVYTRPGQSAFHGSLYATNSSPFMNARTPFSTSKGAIGKQRYSAELNGPITKKGSDFALTLEHRDINNLAIVNAIALDSTGNPTPLLQNVPLPQHLWLGTARIDWQLGAKNTFITSFNARVNDRPNFGVGGEALVSTGYDSRRYDNSLRLSDVTTISTHLMHEARLSLRWDGETDLPNSLTPQIQVAGAFTGGGSTTGAQQLHELNTEFDDDAILTTKHHVLKAGTQLFLFRERQQLTTNFNGTYIFGGSPTQSGLQQYAAGTPTAFTGLSGNPTVNFTQVQDALFLQDDWDLGNGLHIATGLRYFLQNDPTTYAALAPRLGILWSPGKKSTWSLHAHAGLFSGRFNTDTASAVRLNDGVHTTTNTVYNPVCAAPGVAVFNPATCNLSTGTFPIQTIRQFSPHIQPLTWGGENIGGTKSLPQGWKLSADYYFGRIWNFPRSNNINAPFASDPNGPRPGAANLNILQVQNSGQGRVSATFFGIDQHTYKHIQFFVGAVRIEQIDDTNDDDLFTPQNSRSDAGEFARRSGNGIWQTFGNATINLPLKLGFSLDYNGTGGQHYNIVTGFDNNGDGNFNDRPQYAPPGSVAGRNGVTATRYGLLVASGGIGVFPRNVGTMPWTFYLDTKLDRPFHLNNPKSTHPQTITPNIRTYNILNHTNVTSIGNVLGSPQFDQPYSADPGRSIQAGLLYSF